MTEQIRTVSRERRWRVAGSIDDSCLNEIRRCISDFLELPLRCRPLD